MFSFALPRFFWFASAPDDGGDRPEHSGKRERKAAEPQSNAPTTSPDESQLITRIRLGDVEAFAVVYRRHYEPAVKFAYQFMQSREAAQDLAQDVFGVIWERRESLNVYGDLRTYLLSAVRHRALDIIRHARVVDRAADVARRGDDVSGMGMGRVPQTDIAAEEAVLHAAFMRVVAALPERQRSALVLRWEQGLSNREIAQVLGIGEAAVSRLLSRIADALVQLM